MVPDYLGGISVLVCFVAAFVSLGFGFSVVPRQGKMVASQTGNRGPGASDYDSEKGMAFLAVAAPLTPGIFGITALILRLSLMVAGGLVLASFMTYASEHLAIR
ncbi:putative glucuronosyltransferase [Helianthus debilis subsp. tardiflorus]